MARPGIWNPAPFLAPGRGLWGGRRGTCPTAGLEPPSRNLLSWESHRGLLPYRLKPSVLPGIEARPGAWVCLLHLMEMTTPSQACSLLTCEAQSPGARSPSTCPSSAGLWLPGTGDSAAHGQDQHPCSGCGCSWHSCPGPGPPCGQGRGPPRGWGWGRSEQLCEASHTSSWFSSY